MNSFKAVKFNGKTYDLTNTLTLGIDENDGLLYLYVNDQKQGEGIEINEVAQRFTISRNAGQSMLSNPARGIVEGGTYESDVEPFDGYRVNNVTVTMGGDLVQDAYNPSTGKITVTNVSGNLVITVSTSFAPVDVPDIVWANHAITCGQDTNSYNAWSPHNLQYDEVNDCFVFLQCHANRHMSKTYTNWTLSIINPYDASDYEDITIPSFIGLGMLFVENGVWTLMPREQSFAYRSSDRGETWETLQANIPQYLFGVYKCGNTYFGGNDSNNAITYYKSSDLLTWETVSFDSSLGYSVLCETSFCEWGGKWWAFNRTNDSTLGHPVILQSTDDGETWTLFSDQDLHGYRSTVSCCPFGSYLAVVDIDRDGGYLYYNAFDGEEFTQIESWKVPYAGDDFHNANIVTNYKDTIIIEFMHASSGMDITSGSTPTYYTSRTCDNVMLLGSTEDLPSLNFDYIDTFSDMVSYLNENCISGNHSQRTYSWAKYGEGVNMNCYYGESVSGFDDEVVIPLNLVKLNGGTNMRTVLKNGKTFAKAWSNTVTGPYTDINRNASAGTCKQGFLDIGGHRYTLGINASRADALPVLTRQDYNYTMPDYSLIGDFVSVVGQTWQEELGFRRVFSVRDQSASSSSDTCVYNDNFSDSYEHAFATISYTPVS